MFYCSSTGTIRGIHTVSVFGGNKAFQTLLHVRCRVLQWHYDTRNIEFSSCFSFAKTQLSFSYEQPLPMLDNWLRPSFPLSSAYQEYFARFVFCDFNSRTIFFYKVV